ncbi:MauE/DoxX family redox-associated membrane protein [Flavobacterium aquidurense]|uniref:MauE/DoxX family redox-associated membrane protein n=1 Tax=Flavobacterium aquidurense TaxID=362413 RepID=UPI002860BCF4|nr:MauE/DoxX family redox-associated membrane protein [Flavobacterium aquidurense]MDR7371069.1 putative membrane protein YphA (DoxX/SURF4 family) [Flavobacterium aquidurense]
MKLNTKNKSLIVEIISLLYILLFIYAAISKILDFENFQVQLGQSPILSAFASWISWLVPIIEIIISLLLCIPKFRNFGLFGAFSLMIMFTAYIFIVLHFSSFVPCSCGGILEKMSWNIHLFFNVLFVFLAAAALVFQYKNNRETFENDRMILIKRISISIVFSSMTVIILFLYSENIIHNENPFIRRYPQHPIMMTHSKDIKFNSYYFAGSINGRIYLGNYTDPLHLLSMDNNLQNQTIIKISFDPKKIPFKLVTIRIRGHFFYLMDGTVPVIYRGSILDWKVREKLNGSPYFNLAVPIDSTHIVFRSHDGKNSSHIIGLFSPNGTPKIVYNKEYLQKQIDGVFDTDGMLLYDEKSNKIVYLYYYRNEFVISNKSVNLVRTQHTIDTNSRAKIKIAYLRNGDRTMSEPPLMINPHSTVYDNLLFIHSKVKGKYEVDKLWEQASIIDVYDIEKASYLMSFAIYGIKGKKINSFYVTETNLYALIGDQLVVHEFRSVLGKEFNHTQNSDLK